MGIPGHENGDDLRKDANRLLHPIQCPSPPYRRHGDVRVSFGEVVNPRSPPSAQPCVHKGSTRRQLLLLLRLRTRSVKTRAWLLKIGGYVVIVPTPCQFQEAAEHPPDVCLNHTTNRATLLQSTLVSVGALVRPPSEYSFLARNTYHRRPVQRAVITFLNRHSWPMGYA